MSDDQRTAAKDPRIRLSDIAARLGVSSATVSRALNGTGYVRPDLAEDIRRTAQEMRYRMPPVLSGAKVLLVASEAAMVDFARNQFTLYVLEGLRERADARGVGLEIAALETLAPAGRADLPAGVSGVLLLTADDDMRGAVRGLPCPVVLINGDDPAMELSSVTPSNRYAAALATRHLRELGHQRIAFLQRSGRRTIRRREEGWRDEMGPLADPALLLEASDWTADAARAAVAPLLVSASRPTAIVAAGDVLAAGAIAAAKEAGLTVPGELSVIGIDGLPQGAVLTPALTSVAIPLRELGAEALNLLCDMLIAEARGESLQVRQIELACEISRRDSTAPPPVGL